MSMVKLSAVNNLWFSVIAVIHNDNTFIWDPIDDIIVIIIKNSNTGNLLNWDLTSNALITQQIFVC